MALAINAASNPHLDALFQVGSVRREQAINFFIKILTNIIQNPQETKYQDLNHTKIAGKFAKWNCNEPMIGLLKQAGFKEEVDTNRGDDTKNRLKLASDINKVEQVLNELNNKQKLEEERLQIERQKIIEANNKRLNNKANQIKKEKKNRILAQHNEQMRLAKQGIYNVGSSVSDRKGTGNGVNSLSY